MDRHSPAGFDLETVDRLLSTTRAVRRRLDLDREVDREVVLDCIRLSQQTPTGGNAQGWRWVVVDDPEKRKALGAIYARGRASVAAHSEKIPAHERQTRRVYEGALWLAEHIGEVPLLVIPCIEGRPPDRFVPIVHASVYGSILPAVWSFQLALRSRGMGSVLTTLHLQFEEEVGALLGIPADVLQVALLPVAYTVGTEFKAAKRPPAESIAYWNAWGQR